MRSNSAWSRRTFDRSSRIDSVALSSTQTLSVLRCAAACVSLLQSLGASIPVRTRLTSTRASEQSMRLTICSRGISSEKMTTAYPGSCQRSFGIARALELLRAGDVDRDVQDEARLAHAGARRDDRQLAVVQAARDPIVAVEPGRDAVMRAPRAVALVMRRKVSCMTSRSGKRLVDSRVRAMS